MKKLDLHEFEIIGAEIGYPFYVYDDGSYGKKRKKAGAHTIMVIRGGVSPAKALIDDELPAKQHTDPEPVRVVLHNCLEKAEKASSANKVIQNHSCPASYKEAIALLRRCFANKNFYLLERYLKCCGMYPKYRLNPKPQRVLVEEAIHNKEVLGWFKSYFVKDALL